MATSRKYIHDRLILLLLTANGFFTLLTSAVVLWWRLGAQTDSYIVQYRPTLGLSAYQKGGALSIYSFAAFVWITLVFNTILSVKIYPIRRNLAIIILMMTLLLIVLALFISFALLRLR